MNPAYNKTLSLLVEIKSNVPNPGMGGERGGVDPEAAGSNKSKFMGGFGKGKFIGTSVPKKKPLYKKILGAFTKKFGRNNDEDDK